MSAPERIWATMMDPECARSGTFVDLSEYPEKPNNDAVEYIRADLVQQWQPIETAPRDGTRFLAYERLDCYGLYECWWQEDFSNWSGWQDDWDSEPQPTHWMPLPNPPEDK